MTGLDTNVLVRYLTQDAPAQARAATAFMNGLVERGERAFIGPVVMCELVWVLRDAYDTPKDEVVGTLERLMATAQFEIGSRDQVRQAIEGYRSGRADFADYLIGEIAQEAGCEETVTFDRRVRGAVGFRVL